MFQWDKSINNIDVESGKVLHLFKSMREVQLALPGVTAQEASAYLCQFVHDNGVATVAVFHLHKNQLLAFYCSDPYVVPVSQTDAMLDDGLNFVESMGFLMTDQDIHLLEADDQEMLWSSLPLKGGITDLEEEPSQKDKQVIEPVPAVQEKVAAATEPKKVETVETVKAPTVKTTSVKEAGAPPKITEAEDDVAENVDDLLAAVEAMRAKRPGLRARKLVPSQEEILRRKQELRENIGRILASQ